MKEKLIAWMNGRNYNSHLLRMIVGGYIAYMGIQIMLNQYRDGAFQVILSLCAIFLILAGTPIALISLYAVLHGYSEEYKGKTSIFRKDAEKSDAGDENE